MTPDPLDTLARKRANAKLGWYIHASVFVLVNVGVWLLAASGQLAKGWSIKPVLGWGLGLALHGISVWWLGPGSRLREQLVQREREFLEKQRGDPS